MYKSKGIDVYPHSSNNKKINITTTNPDFCIDVNMRESVDKFFKFIQGVPSSEWVIVHNLDKYPSVTVVDSAENTVIGEVQYINSNKLIVTFTAPFSGKAYLN